MSEQTTGAQRAAARKEARAKEVEAYYANTDFPVNERAEAKRQKKALEKYSKLVARMTRNRSR